MNDFSSPNVSLESGWSWHFPWYFPRCTLNNVEFSMVKCHQLAPSLELPVRKWVHKADVDNKKLSQAGWSDEVPVAASACEADPELPAGPSARLQNCFPFLQLSKCGLVMVGCYMLLSSSDYCIPSVLILSATKRTPGS